MTPDHGTTAGSKADNSDYQRLRLQRLERSLVRAQLLEPNVLAEPDYQSLRYAIGLARLHRFAPRGGNGEVTVDPQTIAAFRGWLLERLYASLRGDAPTARRLSVCAQAAVEIRHRAEQLRTHLLEQHANHFDSEALDREAGHRALVSVAGGGGGAGYVYIGAYARLHEAGLIPDYIVGNSIGSVIGLFRAYQRRLNVDNQVGFVKSMRPSDILGTARRGTEMCLPGLLQLHLRALHKRFVTGDLRRPLRLDEMEIPLDLVVAGLRQGSYERLPQDIRRPEGRARAAANLLPFPVRLASRLWRLARFMSPEVSSPFVFGRDADTRKLNAVDVVGFSGAVPTVLQYELRGHAGATREIFAEFMHRHNLAALVDGGVADNVPTHAAWEGVATGRIGTRNAYYLAFDCFSPQIEFKHLWLWPIMQAVQVQMRRNRVYADTMIRFSPTLSPVNLVPGVSSLDLAFSWGWQQMDKHIPFAAEIMRPVSLFAGDNHMRQAS